MRCGGWRGEGIGGLFRLFTFGLIRKKLLLGLRECVSARTNSCT